jgi:predicted fused transcriptional regulator/phosphomethylpyrimidine kinase
MSFHADLNALFDRAIEPAVRQAGYEPVRIDRKEHTNSIDDEIIGSIRKSRFMVADFTGNRAGVYFEAGMMGGLGRTVIWMCDRRELDRVHFDVRQRNFIDWDTPEDARRRLYKRILAIEGEGPNLAPK